ncbi:MAG: trypsin-like peptidase domain-containing protein, partial [Thiohalorhabdaceae bacterium]
MNPRRLSSHALKAVVLGLALVTTACADPGTHSGGSQPSAAESGNSGGAAAALPSFTGIVEANREAVVNISTTRKVGGSGPQIPERFKGTPFEEFFKRFFGGPGGGPERKVHSLGSGFIVSSDGHIVTNAHVVKDASKVVVQLANRRQLKAKVLGKDMATDLAVLKVDAEALSTVEWAQGSGPQVGEWVVAMGSPFGFEHSVTAGIVSAKGRSMPGKAGSYVPFLQTDVAINPGSSGGPLFNLDGEVVGVNAQIYSKSGGYMGLSFAIPSKVARDVVAEIKADGEVSHGYLGVAVQDMNRELARSMGLDKPRGGLIAKVRPDTPAEKAGLKSGDIILKVGGRKIAQAGDIPPLIGGMDPGTEVT